MNKVYRNPTIKERITFWIILILIYSGLWKLSDYYPIPAIILCTLIFILTWNVRGIKIGKYE